MVGRRCDGPTYQQSAMSPVTRVRWAQPYFSLRSYPDLQIHRKIVGPRLGNGVSLRLSVIPGPPLLQAAGLVCTDHAMIDHRDPAPACGLSDILESNWQSSISSNTKFCWCSVRSRLFFPLSIAWSHFSNDFLNWLEGARSMLNVRAAFQSDHWRTFLEWHIEHEVTQTHPNRHLIQDYTPIKLAC